MSNCVLQRRKRYAKSLKKAKQLATKAGLTDNPVAPPVPRRSRGLPFFGRRPNRVKPIQWSQVLAEKYCLPTADMTDSTGEK